jgi:hypothetical protein
MNRPDARAAIICWRHMTTAGAAGPAASEIGPPPTISSCAPPGVQRSAASSRHDWRRSSTASTSPIKPGAIAAIKTARSPQAVAQPSRGADAERRAAGFEEPTTAIACCSRRPTRMRVRRRVVSIRTSTPQVLSSAIDRSVSSLHPSMQRR